MPRYSFSSSISFKESLIKGNNLELDAINIGYGDIAFLQYTGGTTGLSKGAMISHRNMLFNIHQSKAWQAGAFDDDDIIIAITALPLYHIFSLQSNCLAMMLDGGENILITNPRDFPGFIKELSKHKFVYITGVNTLFASLLNTPGFEDLDFSALRLSIGGGMAIQEAVSKKWGKNYWPTDNSSLWPNGNLSRCGCKSFGSRNIHWLYWGCQYHQRKFGFAMIMAMILNWVNRARYVFEDHRSWSDTGITPKKQKK